MHVKKNDMVMVTTGKERGKQGKVLRVVPEKGVVYVEKLNILKCHMRPSQKNRQGGILEKEGPLHLSNVKLICSKCSKPSRTRIRVLEDKRHLRECKECGEVLD